MADSYAKRNWNYYHPRYHQGIRLEDPEEWSGGPRVNCDINARMAYVLFASYFLLDMATVS